MYIGITTLLSKDLGLTSYHFTVGTLTILQQGLWWYATMNTLPDAIRYIDPTWNDESPNGLLYPSIFYLFGAPRVSDTQVATYVEEKPVNDDLEDDASTDEDSEEIDFAEKIWLLALDM